MRSIIFLGLAILLAGCATHPPLGKATVEQRAAAAPDLAKAKACVAQLTLAELRDGATGGCVNFYHQPGAEGIWQTAKTSDGWRVKVVDLGGPIAVDSCVFMAASSPNRCGASAQLQIGNPVWTETFPISDWKRVKVRKRERTGPYGECTRYQVKHFGGCLVPWTQEVAREFLSGGRKVKRDSPAWIPQEWQPRR